MPLSNTERAVTEELRALILQNKAYGSCSFDVSMVVLESLLSIISRLAAERSEVVHSYWREDRQFGPECANCNEPAPYAWDREKYKSDHCPKCGARMDAGKREGEHARPVHGMLERAKRLRAL